MLTSVEKGSEGLRNRVSIIITINTDNMRIAAYLSVPFITFFSYYFLSILYHFIYGCRYNFVQVYVMYS